MGKIFLNQPFKIELEYDTLPAVPSTVEIKYVKPNGQRGSFAAMLDEVGKKIYYWSTAGEKLMQAGMWSFWSVITDANGDSYPGEMVKVRIWREGE